jgi:hypothetical protein
MEYHLLKLKTKYPKLHDSKNLGKKMLQKLQVEEISCQHTICLIYPKTATLFVASLGEILHALKICCRAN